MRTANTAYEESFLLRFVQHPVIQDPLFLDDASRRGALINVGKYYGSVAVIRNLLFGPRIFYDELDYKVSTITVCYLYPEEIHTTLDKHTYTSDKVPLACYIPSHRPPQSDSHDLVLKR